MRIFSPRQSWLLLSLASLLFLASLFIALSERPGPDGILHQGNPLDIAIEVAGEIPNPGIYSFPRQVTVEQALLKAGGIEGGNIGNPQVLNKTLDTGSKVVVTRNQEQILTLTLARMDPDTCIVFFIPLDLNETEEEHLTLIPGIGPRLAQRIIQYRSEKGGFREIEELMEVRGIGEQNLRNLKRYLIIPKE